MRHQATNKVIAGQVVRIAAVLQVLENFQQ
jgi:hypothetical protein